MTMIKMPTELTAENGAKAAFMGEFLEEVEVTCPECGGDNDDDDDDFCEMCGNENLLNSQVFISWANIKAIYKKAVELFGEEPEGWQPIKTAPKDKVILVFDKDLINADFNPEGVVEAFWSDEMRLSGPGFMGAIWNDAYDEYCLMTASPSHWMPKPKRPRV